MTRPAYYNEVDAYAASWLRNLVAAGLVPPGDVDDRSICDVRPDDVAGYAQVHFFAGIGGWAYACRLAGWADDRPIWTGSCPCQPFSVAGRRGGTDDARHLWPDLLRLIRAVRPPVVMGEQVAGAAGYGWFDGVQADLAGEGYASRGVDIPACAMDAPHIRSRLYWCAMANAERGRREAGYQSDALAGKECAQGCCGHTSANAFACHDGTCILANAGLQHGRGGPGQPQDWQERADLHGCGSLADAMRQGRDASAHAGICGGEEGARTRDGQPERLHGGNVGHASGAGLEGVACPPGNPAAQCEAAERADGRNGTFWSDAEWIACHDGKSRRAQPGTPLLVDGLPGRVALWRGFGNAIVPQVAAEVIGAFMDCAP